jgi:hypothetical protein
MLLDRFISRCVIPLARWLAERREVRGRMRALWGATPILTLPLKARATSHLGFKSTTVVFQTYYISQDFDLNLRRLANGAARLGPWAAAFMDRLVIIWALLRFDIFHFFFDRGLMRPEGRFGIRRQELDWLRMAGKRVYGFAYGADVRLRQSTLALGRWNFCVECPKPTQFCLCEDGAGAVSLARAVERLTAPVTLGDMTPYVPNARNLHYWPIDLDRVSPAAAPRVDGPLRIAHAPNHTHFKGSGYLEAAIRRLRAEGSAIDYVKVQGVPNAEVIRLFGEADLVADQFIGGAYGYTALEAMARCKPVITYVRHPALVEAVEECPLVNATPDTLEETLRWCLGNRAALAGIGAQGRAYVARWHSVEAVAARLGQLYLDTADFSPEIASRIRATVEGEKKRRAEIRAHDFEHPFRISLANCARLEQFSRSA